LMARPASLQQQPDAQVINPSLAGILRCWCALLLSGSAAAASAAHAPHCLLPSRVPVAAAQGLPNHRVSSCRAARRPARARASSTRALVAAMPNRMPSEPSYLQEQGGGGEGGGWGGCCRGVFVGCRAWRGASAAGVDAGGCARWACVHTSPQAAPGSWHALAGVHHGVVVRSHERHGCCCVRGIDVAMHVAQLVDKCGHARILQVRAVAGCVSASVRGCQGRGRPGLAQDWGHSLRHPACMLSRRGPSPASIPPAAWRPACGHR